MVLGISNLKFLAFPALNHKGRSINAKSTIDMMMSAVSQGELLILRTEGEDEKEAMAALSVLIEEKAGA